MLISELANAIGEHSSGLKEWVPEEILVIIEEEMKEIAKVETSLAPTRPTHQEFFKYSDIMVQYLAHNNGEDVRGYKRAIKAVVGHC